MENQPSYEEYSRVIEELLATFKYMKFGDIANQFFESLLKLLNRLVNIFGENIGEDVASSAKVILIIIVAIISIMLMLLVIRLFMRRKKSKKITHILGEEISEASSTLNFRERGEICRLNGQYREAARLQFIAVLLYLHQNNKLYHDYTMTGREMINKLRERDFVAIESFSLMVDYFNLIWYGLNQIDEEQYLEWSQNEKRFWQEVRK